MQSPSFISSHPAKRQFPSLIYFSRMNALLNEDSINIQIDSITIIKYLNLHSIIFKHGAISENKNERKAVSS